MYFIFFFPLRATRGHLSATDLPGGGSQGFNQCTEDVVETRGESQLQSSHDDFAPDMVIVSQ